MGHNFVVQPGCSRSAADFVLLANFFPINFGIRFPRSILQCIAILTTVQSEYTHGSGWEGQFFSFPARLQFSLPLERTNVRITIVV